MRILHALSLAGMLTASSCAHRGEGPPIAHPLTDGTRALRLHGSLRQHVQSLSAVARVEQRGEAGRIRGTVYALLATPSRLRFDVMTQLGPVATLTSDGARFALLDQREGRYFEGPACARNVARFLGVELPPEQVMTLLAGGVPEPGPDAVVSLRAGERGYEVVIDERGARAIARFAVPVVDRELPPTEQRLRLQRLALEEPPGNPRMTIAYDDYRVVPDPLDEEEPQRGVALPHVVRIDDRVNDTELTVRFRELQLNGEVVDDVFVQEPPAGLAPEFATCD